jgi:hypothetical protein
MHHRPIEDAGSTRAQHIGHAFSIRPLSRCGQHESPTRAQTIDLSIETANRTRPEDHALRVADV